MNNNERAEYAEKKDAVACEAKHKPTKCPKCYGEGIVGEHAELCDLCFGKGYVSKEIADDFVKSIIQLSEILMESDIE